MASFENDSVRCLYKQMLKLSKSKLTKLCKQHAVSHIGSKKEMTDRILQKQEAKRKKKRKKKARIKRKSLKHNERNKKKETKLKMVRMKLPKYESVITQHALCQKGYKKIQQITPTLQGEVFIATKTNLHRDYLLIYVYIGDISRRTHRKTPIRAICDVCYSYLNEDVVIKRANKTLHYKEGKQETENIIFEAQLLSMFTAYNAPKSLIKYHDFFEDECNYYLVMEKGAKSLFDFTILCHEWIANGTLSICEWIKCVSNIFRQMVQFIEWMHNKAHCCHLDVSLENILITNDTLYVHESDGIHFKHLEIRFIDFGVTQMFDRQKNIDCICHEYVGKTGYKAPEIYRKNGGYKAQKADIWSLGICLFIMSIGAPPYNVPNASDKRFEIIMDGSHGMKKLLRNWNRLHYVESEQFDLIMNMMAIEPENRLNVKQIQNHEWFNKMHHNQSSSTDSVNIIESNTCQYLNNEEFAASVN